MLLKPGKANAGPEGTWYARNAQTVNTHHPPKGGGTELRICIFKFMKNLKLKIKHEIFKKCCAGGSFG